MVVRPRLMSRSQNRPLKSELRRPLLLRPTLRGRRPRFQTAEEEEEGDEEVDLEHGQGWSSGEDEAWHSPERRPSRRAVQRPSKVPWTSSQGRRVPPRSRKSRKSRTRAVSNNDETVLRLSVYCVGDVVQCQMLLKRYERGKVRRPQANWVDALWENAVHSYQEIESTSFEPRDNRRKSAYLREGEADDGGDLDASDQGEMQQVGSLQHQNDDLEATREKAKLSPRSPGRNNIDASSENRQEWLQYEQQEWSIPNQRPSNEENQTRHVFVFGFGCVVFWGFEKSLEREIVEGLLADPAIISGITSDADRVEAHDTMMYKLEPGTKDNCKNDVIRLESDNPLEKFSLSYALAQSAKLFIWEARVDVTIKDLKHIPERLATTGKSDLTEKHISMMIGKVFIERTQVNLYTEILDTPDFLWEDDAFEPGYVEFREHLDLPERVELLNNRLDILKELLEVLNTQLSNHHSSKLEIIVIWLIIAEILVSMLTLIMDRLLPRGYSHD